MIEEKGNKNKKREQNKKAKKKILRNYFRQWKT